MNISEWKISEFSKANGEKFSPLDFLHAVTTKVSLPADFFVCIGNLFFPRFALFDGVVTVADWFDEKKYQEYRINGMAEDQAQAWANLVEITDVLNGISYEKAKEIAICIVELWRERVRIQFPGAEWQVNHIFDDDAEEVFVTMGRFSSGEGIGP